MLFFIETTIIKLIKKIVLFDYIKMLDYNNT